MIGIVRVPSAWIGAIQFGTTGLWASFVVSNAVGATVAYLWFQRGTWPDADVTDAPPGESRRYKSTTDDPGCFAGPARSWRMRNEPSWNDDPIVGMVHLDPLPGSPGFEGDRRTVREQAVADARALIAGGVDAVLVENFGDAPYYPDEVPRHVVADLAATARELRRAVDCPVGVNVLRNDAEAAVAVAAATGGSFVRVNVHTGARATDQGVVAGRAHETVRLRDRIGAGVAVLADVAVKHSAPVGDRDVAAIAEEAVDRGLADGLIVSGPATGEAADADELEAVVDARDEADRDVPVLVGSGVTPENVSGLFDIADGVIVGTALKVDGETTNPVDADRVTALVDAAGE